MQTKFLKIVGLSRPSNFKRYRLTRYINQGAFGKVYYCDNHSVAVKEIPLRKVREIDRITLTNQIQNLSLIQHKNIVQIRDFFKQNQYLYIVMEYCQQNLYEYLRDKIINQREVIRILHQILQGYKQLLNVGIVHRDLKPTNILVNKQGIIKIADLGCSKKFDKFLNLRSSIGTPLYRAPQTYRQQGYDNKCDIWSLGVIVYKLLSMQIPNAEKNISQFYEKRKKINISFQHMNISNQTRKLIQRMLQFNPLLRIQWKQMIQMVEYMVKCYDEQEEYLRKQQREKQMNRQYAKRFVQQLRSKIPEVQLIQSIIISAEHIERKGFEKNQNIKNRQIKKEYKNTNISHNPIKNHYQNQNQNQNPKKALPRKNSQNINYRNTNELQQPQIIHNIYVDNFYKSPLKPNQNFANERFMMKSPPLYRPRIQSKNILACNNRRSPKQNDSGKNTQRYTQNQQYQQFGEYRLQKEDPQYLPNQQFYQCQNSPLQSYQPLQHLNSYSPSQNKFAQANIQNHEISNYNISPKRFGCNHKRIDSLSKLKKNNLDDASVINQFFVKLQQRVGYHIASKMMNQNYENMVDLYQHHFQGALKTFCEEEKDIIKAKFKIF